jgi:hypothetical protein
MNYGNNIFRAGNKFFHAQGSCKDLDCPEQLILESESIDYLQKEADRCNSNYLNSVLYTRCQKVIM